MASASPRSVLATLRDLSPGTDAASVETSARWPASAADPWAKTAVPPALLKGLASSPIGMPSPPAFLREKTLGAFAKVAIAPADPASGAEQTLDFTLDDPAWKGDLARFVTAKLAPGTKRVHVKATGEGLHWMTGLAMPDGVSLRVTCTTNGPRPIVWTAAEKASGVALISVKHASLDLEGVRLASTTKSTFGAVVSVDHGHLKIKRCVLTAPGLAETGEGGVIQFRTDGSRPFPEQGQAAISDRPTLSITDTVLITGGAAVVADVGRGILAISNCAISAGSNAIVLRPKPVRRDRFDADVVLDHCTIAAERDFVTVGAWKGLPPGPDRPWVIFTNRCVFIDAFRKSPAPPRAVLLRSAAEGLSRGVLAWQSSGDVYDLTHFTAGGAASPPPSARFDIAHGWYRIWGANHIVDARGPKSVRLLVDRLVSGSVAPGDLALDPAFHPGRPALDAGADLNAMDIAPSHPKPGA